MSGPLKILFAGDYSNCHATLAKALQRQGHDVTLMSRSNRLNSTGVDIDISRRPGKLGGLMLYLKALTSWRNSLKGYDIVALNDPMFLQLKPRRLRSVFDRFKGENRSIFYTAMSLDTNYIDMCRSCRSPLKYNEWFVDGKPSPWHLLHPEKWEAWNRKDLVDYQNHVFNSIDGAVSVLYEYHVGLRHRFDDDKIAYGGIPVDTAEIPFIGADPKEKIRLLLCRDSNRAVQKGSDLLLSAASRVVERYPREVELAVAENLPYPLFLEELKKSDIVLDQAYSYTPATTALLAMAMGKTVVSGGEADYYDFIGETDNHPIINAALDADRLADDIAVAALDREFLRDNSVRSREFVVKHNDAGTVAQRFLDFWITTADLQP